MSIPRGIIRIFKNEESKNKAFQEDVAVLADNRMEGCIINHTKCIISMRGQHYAYRSPSMGNAVLKMPLDKIEILEVIDDLPFLAAAMESIRTTQIAKKLGSPEGLDGMLEK